MYTAGALIIRIVVVLVSLLVMLALLIGPWVLLSRAIEPPQNLPLPPARVVMSDPREPTVTPTPQPTHIPVRS